MHRRLILYCLFTLKAVLSNISQSPELVKVPLGGTAYLQCDLGHLMTVCDVISWYKLHPRTQQLNKTTAINTETLEEGQCLGVFHNITVRDSGIYYCVVVYTVMMYMGNGSRVIVTEPNRQPTLILQVPQESAGWNVSLQCLVMGVTPSEVHVSWVIRKRVMTGWTESGWTNDSDSALEFTRAHITLPSEKWMDDVQCVVELDDRKFFTSLKTDVCLLSLGLNAAFVIIVVTVVIAVRTCLAKQKSFTVRSHGVASQVRRRNGKRGTHTVEGLCITEVQYASLDLTDTEHHSRTALSQIR
ncbi:uncharacterized protein LOC107197759 [Astyanax mexicanus]|uniref:Ig-like domain-containing protein n=1 Tax=Astyanax mexicanus TaxID=7994 RepID=A0A8T2M4J1_ASTMX|nr:uncharacterized protein LOC107197759 [Astyanax mexicanus]KAG9279548.1 hypothetical protein AMEX_G5080 [Astyanax mexicanus]